MKNNLKYDFDKQIDLSLDRNKKYVIFHQGFFDWLANDFLGVQDSTGFLIVLSIPIINVFLMFITYMGYLGERKSYRYKILPNKQLKRVRLP